MDRFDLENKFAPKFPPICEAQTEVSCHLGTCKTCSRSAKRHALLNALRKARNYNKSR